MNNTSGTQLDLMLSPAPTTKAMGAAGAKFNATNENIEWAKWSWNPVTGCKHGCKYCYARDIAYRFYPKEIGFNPHFYPERLDAPANTPTKRIHEPGHNNVFVCSMADLFGEWVPQEWIDSVLESVRQYDKWNYLFLTKNPARLATIEWPDNAWVGTTVDCQKRVEPAIEAFKNVSAKVRFISCEPFIEPISFPDMSMFDWIIIGGQSQSSGGPGKQPEWEWVESLLNQSREYGLKVYFKPNLEVRPREYPFDACASSPPGALGQGK